MIQVHRIHVDQMGKLPPPLQCPYKAKEPVKWDTLVAPLESDVLQQKLS